MPAALDRPRPRNRPADPWEREGLLGPSSTWTYLVNDNVFGSNAFLTLSTRASFGLWAVLVCWPLLLVWGLAKHWRGWRRGKGPERAEGEEPARS